MINSFLRLAGLTLVLALAGCDRSTDDTSSAFTDDSGILKYVPSDSAYAFVRLAPVPDEFDERFAEINAATVAYNEVMMGEIASAIGDSEGSEAIRQAMDLAQELSSPGGMERIGLDTDAQLAVYSVNLVPVMRTSVKDAAAFAAKLDEIQDGFDFPAEEGKIGDVSYKYFEADGFRLVWMLSDPDLVVTISHADAGDDALSAQLGITLPDENIADAGTLSSIAADYGYTEHGIGYIDSLQVVDGMLNPVGLIQSLSAEEPWQDELPPVCRDEIRASVANVPRMVAGVTKLDETGAEGSFVIELREDMASDLQGLTAAVPGLGLASDALMSGGFSFNAKVARSFLEKRLAEMTENPFECEFFQASNAGVDQAQEFLERQPLPPTLYDFRGVYAQLDGIDLEQIMADKSPESAQVDMILAMKNPESLTAMATMFLPEFAALGIAPDGELREIPNGALNPTGMSVWVAMTDERIGMSMGEGAESRLATVMAMAPNPDAPLTGLNLNAGAYFALVSDMMTAIPADENETAVDAMGEMMDALGRVYDRLDLSVDIHEKGIVFTSGVTFK